MRILFSTDQVYLHGGIEKVLAEKANYFADVLGYEVSILTTEQQGRKPCYGLSDKVGLLDIGVNYQRHKSYFNPQNLKRIPAHFRKLKQVIRELRPDVIISCNYAFDFYWLPFIFSAVLKCKEFHSSRYFADKHQSGASAIYKLKSKLDDFIETKFDRLILLNPDEQPFYHSQNIKVIPNPISASDITAKLVSRKAVAAGRIAPVKGFDYMIRAWELVIKHCPDCQLEIYGEDYLGTQKKLQQLIDSLQLQDHVRFAGVSDDMKQTMSDFAMYVMTSETECFPMVLLESLSIGLPVVSFDCPTGPRNIITNGQDGFLVENQDIESLAEKIVLLFQNDAQRLSFGKAAKDNSRRFETAKIMKEWNAFLVSSIKNYD